MSLDPYFADRFAALSRLIAEGADTSNFFRGQSVTLPDGVTVTEEQPGKIRTYKSIGGTSSVALLWIHGGGFRHGDLDMPEAHAVAAELAQRTGAFVASAEYRLADGRSVLFPEPLDDVYAAWTWLGDQGYAKIAIGGASAGAALALSALLRARDENGPAASALLLAYPFAHFPIPALDAALAAEMSAALPPVLRSTPESIEDMVRNYVGRISDLPPHAIPGTARLDGLPPTSIMVSEFDDLRPSGEMLGRQLRDLGIPVDEYVAPGMPHGHLNHVADLKGIAGSLDFFAEALTRLS